jgi:hypothetical protein
MFCSLFSRIREAVAARPIVNPSPMPVQRWHSTSDLSSRLGVAAAIEIAPYGAFRQPSTQVDGWTGAVQAGGRSATGSLGAVSTAGHRRAKRCIIPAALLRCLASAMNLRYHPSLTGALSAQELSTRPTRSAFSWEVWRAGYPLGASPRSFPCRSGARALPAHQTYKRESSRAAKPPSEPPPGVHL